MSLKHFLAFALIAAPSAAFAGDDPEAGAFIIRCLACHSVGEGAANKAGPQLNGLFGRPAGSLPDYNYSDANKNSGIVWTEEIFAEYIRDPRDYMPGTKMAFAGVKKDMEVEDIIAYLRQFSADGTIAN